MNIKLLLAFLSLVTFDFSGFNSISDTRVDVQARIVTSDTLVFQLYNDYLDKNDELNIDIFSPNFNDILGFQFAFEMVDLEFVSVIPGSINLSIANYNWKSNTQNLLVSYSDAEAHNVAPGEILFSVKVKAKKSGYVQDVLSINESALTSEAIYLSFDNTSIVLSFDFLERKSTDVIESTKNKSIKVFPNQLMQGQSKVTVEGINILDAYLYKFNGSYLNKCNKIDQSTIEVGKLLPGMYILKIYDGNKYHNEVITII